MKLAPALPAALLLLAACSDALPSGPATTPAPAPAAYRAELRCTADVRQPRLSCDGDAAGGAGPARSMIVGGQHVYVRLTSTGAGYNASDSIFQVDVSVESLMAQGFGTPDGETDTGLRVFFETGPTAAGGAGSVEVDNADGESVFLTSMTPYFAYPGLLYRGEPTDPRPWRFKVDPGVGRFVFTVYVQGELPHEESILLFRPELEPDETILNGLWGTSADTVFAVGFFGALWRYTGGEWVEDASPTEEVLRDVWGSSATDVFAVGTAGTIVHWDGTSWALMDSGLEVEDGECGCPPPTILGVWGSGPSDVFATAEGGVILRYNGVEWTARDTMPTGIFGIWGSGPDDVFVSGDDGSMYHFDGTSWTPMTTGLEGTGEYFNGLWGLSPTDVYAAASTGLLHYDGTGWSPVPGAQDCEYITVWASAPDDVFAVNACGIDHWNGSTWAYMDPGGFAIELWGTGRHHVLANTNGGVFRGGR